MTKHEEMKNFYEVTRIKFPHDSKIADEVYIDLGFEKEDEAYYIWFEAFSEVTNKNMKEQQTANVLKHFEFFMYHSKHGTDVIKNCIDVSYVENLFWKVNPIISRYYWSLLQKPLQELYFGFHHGEPY